MDRLVQSLAALRLPPLLVNQYSPEAAQNDVRRNNLRLYLEEMCSRQPEVLLLGEAAGHRGCRLSGVPFTSTSQLIEFSPPAGIFGVQQGYQVSDEWPGLSREQSATIVWQALAGVPALPLLWNVLPFHPHPAGNVWANRRPSAVELQIGHDFLLRLLEQFPVTMILATGNSAAEALRRLAAAGRLPHGVLRRHIRHPAHGGKLAFTAGVRAALGIM